MKPLLNCPYCGCNLKEVKQNENWHEKYCPDHCIMEYHQYYEGDFTSEKLSYISFHMARYYIYVYFEKGFYPNTIHFYSHRELREKGKASTILWNVPSSRIPTWELEVIDATNNRTRTREWLKEVDEKLNLYTLLS